MLSAVVKVNKVPSFRLTSLSVSFWVTDNGALASGVVRVTDQTPFVTGQSLRLGCRFSGD